MGAPSGVAYANNTLVVADANRLGALPNANRVTIYSGLSDQSSLFFDARSDVPQLNGRCNVCIGTVSTVLGQPDFTTINTNVGTTDSPIAPAANIFRMPLGVAYNGRYLAVSDTENNRVLVWRSLPTTNQQNADFVVGQTSFTTNTTSRTPSATNLRGPQGVWLDENDGLWVADTANNRILYYGVITQNGQAARLVLGQTGLDRNDQGSIAESPKVTASTLLNPIAVTTNGNKVFVTDFALSRVLIWNSMPGTNGQAADVVVGQPDMVSLGANNSSKLCASNGTDADGNATYPDRCSKTLSLPRYAMSDGTRLFISDSGNDRVLVYNTIPTSNAAAADAVLGQLNDTANQSSDTGYPTAVAASDSFRTPGSLAWDGTNLYVADTYNRRVVAYTPLDFSVPLSAVRNAASPEVYAQGSVVFSGATVKDDEISIKIGTSGNDDSIKTYTVKVVDNDNYSNIITQFVTAINTGSGDPLVLAQPNLSFSALVLVARASGVDGNNVSLSATNSNASSTTVLTVSGSTLSGGQDAAQVAPWSLVTILGQDGNLADETSDPQSLTATLPVILGNIEVFFDGLRGPLVYVSPNKIVAQFPREIADATTANAFIRVMNPDGSTKRMSNAIAVRVISQNPGVFHDPGLVPNAGIAYHYSSYSMGTVSVDGTPKSGDVLTISIHGRSYSYTVVDSDVKDSSGTALDNSVALINARNGLVNAINAGNDPEVTAYKSGYYSRVRLTAKIPGPAGDNIPLAASVSTDAGTLLTATNTKLCCSNVAGSPVTESNPAQPGETIVVLATGLGLLDDDTATAAIVNRQPYQGPALNNVKESVSALAGSKTANVLFSGIKEGSVGVYEVHLELNTDLPDNPKTDVTIAQSYQVSNIFTIPVASKGTP